jgi:restriction system protein
MSDRIIGKHGGYRTLRAYQLTEIIYDGTLAFTKAHVDRRSRTVDQMVQAARSAKQNIAEGSAGSATSKKSELKLTGVARASLEELLLDYEDFLRQNGYEQWPKDHEKALFIRRLRHPQSGESDGLGKSDGSDISDGSDRRSIPYDTYRKYIEEKGPENAANTLICLIQQASYLLGRLLQRLEKDFAEEGGVTERMYRTRSARRGEKDGSKG